MFFFGHMGIGSKIVSPWSSGLPKKWLLFGTILPDLIDKPLYYALVLATGRRGSALGLISGTRTIGHTAIFLIVLTALAAERRSKILAAISLGVATHLILDGVTEAVMSGSSAGGFALALTFPVLGWHFPVSPFTSVTEHLTMVLHPFLLGCELVGLALLGWELWKARHASEIMGQFKPGSKRPSGAARAYPARPRK